MKFIIAAILFLATAFCQKPPTKDEALDAARDALMLVSTHAVALFQSADTIDARLRSEGSSLRPSTVTLRLRIEHTLDQAEAAINRGDLTRSAKDIKVAEELVARFSRRIGGE